MNATVSVPLLVGFSYVLRRIYLSLCLMQSAIAGAETLWWEAEDEALLVGKSTAAVDGPWVPETGEEADWLSEGAWMSQPFDTPWRATYRVAIPAAGDYRLFARRNHSNGTFRFRWNDGEWVEVADRRIELERRPPDSVKRTNATWVSTVAKTSLLAGEQKLEIESLINPATGKYPIIGIDAFLVTDEKVVPTYRVKPGDSPAATGVAEKDYARSQAIALRKLSFEERIEELLPFFESGEKRHPSETFVLPYRLMAPRDRQPGKRYPLVIALPSSGGRGEENRRQLAAAEPAYALSRPEMRERYPAFVLCPQAPDWFSDEPRPKVSEEGVPALTTLFLLIDELVQNQPIDPDQISIHGQSLGGYGVFHALQREPERFAAAVMIAGADPGRISEASARVPTWIFCGSDDQRVHASRAAAKRMEQLGGEPRLTIYQGAGHSEAWERAYQEESLWEWLFGSE